MSDDDGLPPWKLDGEDTPPKIRGKSIDSLIIDDDPFSDDFYPADWKPKVAVETKEVKNPIKLIAPPMPEKGKWHRNWFSNMEKFSGESLIYQGIIYCSVENFYQAMKLPKDRLDLRAEIAAMEPRKSKTAIRDKDKYVWDAAWNQEKSLQVMEFALRHKFFPGTSWHKKLMETGEEEIIEWNNWSDIRWGKDIATGEGENLLGLLLMKLRAEYKNTKVINKSSGEPGIFCGRGSIYGNPYTSIKDKETKAEFVVETREESISKFKEYFDKKIKKDLTFKKAVLKLRNETLVCYCDPLPCHVHIIRDWLFKNID